MKTGLQKPPSRGAGSFLRAGALILFALGGFFVAPEAEAGLLLQYTFDDTNNPTANTGSLGSAYNGALFGNAHFVPFGGGNALSLDGNQDYVWPGGTQTAFNIGDAEFSLFARFQTSVALNPLDTINHRFLIRRETSGSNPEFALSIENDTGFGVFNMSNGTAGQGLVAIGNTALNDGAVHEMWGIRLADTLHLYVDGIEQASTAVPGGWGSSNSSAQLVIGGRQLFANPVDDWNGLIDEVRIYDEAISIAAVPEPATAVVGLLCLGLGLTRRRRGKCQP